jgi:hydroxypyruvate isomerase
MHMPLFAANITTMFQELPMSERVQAARRCGFAAVEFLLPYEWSLEEIYAWPEVESVHFILMNTLPGIDGSPGCAAIPARINEFQTSFKETLRYMNGLDIGMVHLMAGKPGENLPEAESCFVENVRWAADLVPEKIILLEALNTFDMPDYLYSMTDHTVSLIERISRPNVKLQFDFYHQQLMEGNLSKTLEKHWKHIGHIQFSSVPGRNEPQYGEVNVEFLFDWLDEQNYHGWIGCEYKARKLTPEGLTWGHRWGLGLE